MCQCSPLTGVRAGSRHLSSCRSLGWCYVHGQPQKPWLAVGIDPEAKGVSDGIYLDSSGGGVVWWSRSQAPGVCKCENPWVNNSRTCRGFTAAMLVVGFRSSKGCWGLL